MGIYRPRSFGLFDPTKPLVAGRQMELGEHSLQGGDPIPDDVEDDIKRRLWMVEHAHYADDWTPTPEEVTHGEGLEWMDEAEGVSVSEGENGWYTISAAWLGEDGEKVHGLEAAEARAAELREAGDTKGVTYSHTGGGWYEVAAPWMETPVKVKGEDAAKAKAEELREQAPSQEPTEGEGGNTGSGEGGEGGEGSTAGE